MKFVFVSAPTFEPWDWTNPDRVGIGGSETSHIEMAQRLSRCGHEVVSYAPVPFSDPRQDPAGVLWKRFDDLLMDDLEAAGDVWVIYRAPHVAEIVPKGKPTWLICQDVDYKNPKDALTPERCDLYTRIVGLCGVHTAYLRYAHPTAAAKVCQSSNGIKRGLIEQIAREGITRNPHRLIYASSPDRGLEYLLQFIFPRLRELVPDLELHTFYGFDNIDKVVAHVGPAHWISKNTERLKALFAQGGVVQHPRTPQPDLIREYFRSAIWLHPSDFTETGCIVSMEAQACGCIPVTNPTWAVSENVQHGVLVEGSVKNEVVQARYVLEAYRLLLSPDVQAETRADMMPWARERFDWQNFVPQWEEWAESDLRHIRHAADIMNTKDRGRFTPTYSLLHASARPQEWRAAMQRWLAQCDNPKAVEYILCVDRAQLLEFTGAEVLDAELGEWGRFRLIVNDGRRCVVDAWNHAAAECTGRMLINIADDYHPALHWDTGIAVALAHHKKTFADEFMLNVDNQDGSTWLLAFNFMSRPYYERLGYFYWPEYEGLVNDTDISAVAQRDRVLLSARQLKFKHASGPEDAVYAKQMSYFARGKEIYARREREGFPTLKQHSAAQAAQAATVEVHA